MEQKPARDTETERAASGPSRLLLAGIALSAAAFVFATGAGPGTRIGWWTFRQGFKMLNWAVYFGAAGTVLSVAGAFVSRPGSGRRGFTVALLGIALGAVSFGVPGFWYGMAKKVPMIHDITTDTDHPPEFVAILPLRKEAPNPAVYGGPEIAAQQKAAYPDIRPLQVPLPVADTYGIALATARRMRWEIVDGNPAEGRIEAVATTRWFGFKDDIVIRISPTGAAGCRVDVRSVSRVGKSDVGTNARRIRMYLLTLAADARHSPASPPS